MKAAVDPPASSDAMDATLAPVGRMIRKDTFEWTAARRNGRDPGARGKGP